MNLAGLRTRLAHLAGAVPHPRPTVVSTDAIQLSFAAGLVLDRLELWAERRPGFEPLPEPTVLHTPDEGDRAMARNSAQLAPLLLKPCLVHAAGVLEARLGDLFSQYQAAGEKDDAIESALADVDERLAALLASGVQIPESTACWLAPLKRVS